MSGIFLSRLQKGGSGRYSPASETCINTFDVFPSDWATRPASVTQSWDQTVFTISPKMRYPWVSQA